MADPNPSPKAPPKTGEPSAKAVAPLTGQLDETGISPSNEPIDCEAIDSNSDAALTQLGGFRILKLLGQGGMGAVYAAEDVALKRQVALKTMRAELARNDKARIRFTREAQAAAAVESDHIVRIYYVGEDAGVPYIAMEFLRGKPLNDWMAGRKPTPAQVLKIGYEMSLGLAAAHEKGLIHRDIKPANIWLEAPAGRVKILDFGLARSVQSDAMLTGSGVILGTPAYMAPEQARGGAIDHRCDLFSLGGVLYHLATGRRAFGGKDTLAILSSLAMDTPVAPQQLNPAIPLALSSLILRLLEKPPEARPGTAREVAAEFRRIQKGEPGQVVPSVAAPVVAARAAAVPATAWEELAISGASEELSEDDQPERVRSPRGIMPYAIGAVGLLATIGIAFGIWKMTAGSAPAPRPHDDSPEIAKQAKPVPSGSGKPVPIQEGPPTKKGEPVFNFVDPPRPSGPTNGVAEPAQLENDLDFAMQGEYESPANGATEKMGAQVIARGDGKFDLKVYRGGLPGAGWDAKTPPIRAKALRKGNESVAAIIDTLSGVLEKGPKATSLATNVNQVPFFFRKIARTSKTLGEKPPAGAVVLFGVKTDVNNWNGGALLDLSDGKFLSVGAKSKQAFGAFRAHFEFRLPWMPKNAGQGRANSGIFLQDRYELQVLDSFGLNGENNECGGIYTQHKPLVNMCLPPMVWQTFDIEFTPARFDGGKKIKNARTTISQNGVMIHDDVELPKESAGSQGEGPSPGVFQLQNHGNPVVYRNIWIVEKK